jgi:type IV secretory pathway VirB3-like protein
MAAITLVGLCSGSALDVVVGVLVKLVTRIAAAMLPMLVSSVGRTPRARRARPRSGTFWRLVHPGAADKLLNVR